MDDKELKELEELEKRKESPRKMKNNLRPGERLDELHRNGYKIIQNENKFCFGMDAVLLSGFANVKRRRDCAGYGNRDGNCPDSFGRKDKRKAFYRAGNSERQCRYGEKKCNL